MLVSTTTRTPPLSLLFLIFSLFVANEKATTAVLAFSGMGSQRVFVSTPVTTRKRVNDCMTPIPRLRTVSESTSVDDAMAMLLQLGVSGAPVVDDETGTKLVGVISSYDFLQKEAFGGSLLPMEGSAETVEGYVDIAKRICAKKVSDIMSPKPATIRFDASMREASTLMAKEHLNRLPVVDGNGALVGILTTSDVMKDLIHIVRNLPETKDDDKKEKQ